MVTWGGHLPRWLAGEEFPLSLPRSISSISHPSKLTGMLLTLGSELALLHVARGESIAPIVLLFVGFVLTLYPQEAGTFVRTGRRLPAMLRFISMCLIAISKDFLERFLPKPELSEDEGFPAEPLRVL